MGQAPPLPRLLGEVKRRLDDFDVHGLASEEFRRAVYTLYEMVRDIYAALVEVEREFDDAYEAFSKIVEKQETARARELLDTILGEEGDGKDGKKVGTGQYL